MKLITTSSGELGKQLTQFPRNYIQPTINRKRDIQTGYLDLLYFEYREEHADWRAQTSAFCILLSIMITMGRDHLGILLSVIVASGIYAWHRSNTQSNEFRIHRQAIQKKLRELGVGISHAQLNDTALGSTAWGQLAGHTTSNLGIVRPVSTEGFVEPIQYLFDIFDDEVYR